MKVEGLRTITLPLKAASDPRVLNKAVISLFGDMDQRIFVDGMAADGSPIGKYGTKPMYVNPKELPVKLPPIGKTGKKQFKDGKPHVTRYFAGGWKDVRNQTGRRIDRVNLDFTGGLHSGFSVDVSGKNPTIGFIDDLSAEKAEGNEDHFGKLIFDLTDKELNSLDQKISDSLTELGL